MDENPSQRPTRVTHTHVYGFTDIRILTIRKKVVILRQEHSYSFGTS